MSYWAAPKDEVRMVTEEDNNPSDKEKDMKDDLKVPLMNSILLYSTIGINSSLKDPDLVNKIQTYYLSKLHRYLKYIYGDNDAMIYLTEGMKLASIAREAQNIWSYRLPVSWHFN